MESADGFNEDVEREFGSIDGGDGDASDKVADELGLPAERDVVSLLWVPFVSLRERRSERSYSSGITHRVLR